MENVKIDDCIFKVNQQQKSNRIILAHYQKKFAQQFVFVVKNPALQYRREL